MSVTRTLNVITLTLILFLAGCFGLGDSAEAADEHEHTPNAAPVLHAELMMNDMNGEVDFNVTDCTASNCTITSYHAAVDPDGDMMYLGYDFDLDGTIDYHLTNHRGMTDLVIPRTEFIETVISVDDYIEESNCVGGQQLVITETSTISSMITTIALIGVDSNDAASAILLTSVEMFDISTIISDSTEGCDENAALAYQFSDRDAAGTMSDAGSEALVHVSKTQGDDLSWAVLRVSIVVDGGVSMRCDEAGSADATSDCTFAIDDDNYWSTSEEITISEGADDLCDGENGGCSVDVTLTKKGVGNEDDKVIRTVTAYADASN